MAKPKHPVLTVEALREWLKKQKRNRRYSYLDNRDCLIARFVKAQGFENVYSRAQSVNVNGVSYGLSERLNHISWKPPSTYAAALKRAQGAS